MTKMTEQDQELGFVFEYNEHKSHEANFRDWWIANTEERLAWNVEPLREEQARLVFDNHWGAGTL